MRRSTQSESKPRPSAMCSAQRQRGRNVVVGLCAALAALALRLVLIQLGGSEHFERLARRQQIHTEELLARPGSILDSRGRMLAASLEVQSLYADPALLEEPWPVAQAVAGVLKLDPDALFEKFVSHPGRRFVWIKRRLSPQEVSDVRSLNLPEPGVGFRTEYRRFYPQGPVAVHVLGFRDIDGVGRGGVEQSLDEVLRGHNGQRRIRCDAHGRGIAILDDQTLPPTAGGDVWLTIDGALQMFVEEALDELMRQWQPLGAAAVVLDPNNGEVLAIANRPAFDHNQLDHVSDQAWRNRAVNDMYEPGSTFKPVVMSRALDAGVVRPGETIFCENGAYRMGGRILHDHRPHGELKLADVIVRSSNIGMSKVGQRLGNAALYQAVVDFGFGQPTGIELPGEAAGTVRPLRQWTRYSTGSVPMGHEIACTPLQLIRAYCALANGGRLLRPTIIRAVGQRHRPEHANGDLAGLGSMTDLRPNEPTTGLAFRSWGMASLHPIGGVNTDGPGSYPILDDRKVELVGRPVEPETAAWLIDPVLKDVVLRGTGRRAQVEGYTVFGKSGTAEKLKPDGSGYAKGRYISSFVLGGPLPQPRAVVLVMVDEPKGDDPFGGKVAAPTAARIIEQTLRYLRVPPQGPTL